MTAGQLQTIDPAELKIREEGEAIIATANALAIVTADDYAEAVELGKSIKRSIEAAVAYFDPLITPQRASLQALYDRKNSHTKPLEEALEIARNKAIKWKGDERKRLEAVQRDLEAKQRKLDEERQLDRALDAEEFGDTAGGLAILDEPAPSVYVPVPRPAAPKIAGAADTKRWTFDDTKVDVAAIIKHIAGIPPDQKLAHPELVTVLALDSKVVRQLITAMRENFNVPGIIAFEKDGMSLSTK